MAVMKLKLAECPAKSDSLGSSQSVSVAVTVATSPPRALRRDNGPPIGLRNLTKTTCYLNSVLQCLTFTPPLAEYCRSRLHSKSCTRSDVGDCTFCILEGRISLSLIAALKVDTPTQLYKQLMSNSDYEPGRQEDAHELLRFLINDSGKAFESNKPVMPPGSLNDPKFVLDRMFGGVLQSHIECRRCRGGSTKHDEMLDLSLEISHLSSLADALACFFRTELLDGDNKYRCGSCNQLSAARKRMSIHRAPKVLTIQLMRFDPFTGRKLNHHVLFEERLSVGDYMSKKLPHDRVTEYKLYGVIVHLGSSQDCGHYLACVKETNGKWYVCDDETVTEVSEEKVLRAKAYLLFYIRTGPSLRHSL